MEAPNAKETVLETAETSTTDPQSGGAGSGRTPLQLLMALAVIDEELIRLGKRLKAGPEEIAQREAELEAARSARREAETAIREKTSEVDEKNLDLRTYEADIAEAEELLHGIKNNKEYRILTDRIKDMKQSINEMETTAITLMDELDGMRTDLRQKQEAVSVAEEALTALRAEVDQEAAEIHARAQALRSQREEKAGAVRSADINALEQYEQALRRGRGVAMAEMVDGICQVCFRKLSPNAENAVLVGKDLKQSRCAGCGRLLYHSKNL